MKKICLLMLVLLLVDIRSAGAVSRQYMEQKCQRLMRENPPEIMVSYNYGQLKYDHTQDRAGLEKIFKTITPEKDLVGEIDGVTLLNPKVETASEMRLEELSSDHGCLMPKKVMLHVMFVDPTIYILKNLPEDTCRYKLTLRHEQTHADIGHSALYLFAKVAQKQLQKKVAEQGARIVTAENVEQSVQEMNLSYQNGISELFAKFTQVLKDEQAELDTAENYAKETALCR